MRALTASELLFIWERGGALALPGRALLLLGAACPETPADELHRLSVGRRDNLLLQLRAAAFGPQLEATSTCPRCGEKLEMTFSTDELCSPTPEPANSEPLALRVANYALSFRLPNSLDLAELAVFSDLDAAEAALLRRCVLSARVGERSLAPDELPELVVDALAARLAEGDPKANLQLALDCPGCDHRWTEIFDIVGFFWREIEAWAVRLLREVHLLARAYSWSEAEIVALSPARRQIYLEMAAS